MASALGEYPLVNMSVKQGVLCVLVLLASASLVIPVRQGTEYCHVLHVM